MATTSQAHRSRQTDASHYAGKLCAADSRLGKRQPETRLNAVSWIYGFGLFPGREKQVRLAAGSGIFSCLPIPESATRSRHFVDPFFFLASNRPNFRRTHRKKWLIPRYLTADYLLIGGMRNRCFCSSVLACIVPPSHHLMARETSTEWSGPITHVIARLWQEASK